MEEKNGRLERKGKGKNRMPAQFVCIYTLYNRTRKNNGGNLSIAYPHKMLMVLKIKPHDDSRLPGVQLLLLAVAPIRRRYNTSK